MAYEERVLKFNGFKIRLCYLEDGEVDVLLFEGNDGTSIAIRSKSETLFPEKIYELLRECQVSWK